MPVPDGFEPLAQTVRTHWVEIAVATVRCPSMDISCPAGIRKVVVDLLQITLYATLRCFYNVYFHPLAKYPGPKLAAISYVWYSYQWFVFPAVIMLSTL